MKKILLIDDEKIIRDGLQAMISRMPGLAFEIGQAGDGEEALRAAEGMEPDVLLLDVRMPNMDGLAFLERYRAGGGRGKVLILSGYGEFDYAKKAIQYGAFDYLLKPVQRSVLFAALKRAVEALEEEQDRQPRSDGPQEERAEGQGVSAEAPEKAVRKTITLARQYIGEHYKEALTLGDIAEYVEMNPSYFSVLFKKEMGVSFTAYLNDIRLREAMRLLRDSRNRVYEVALAVGFQDEKYFSKVFKKRVGQSPRDYREQS